MDRQIFANPLAYYCWLRRTFRYTPRMAWASTVMVYSANAIDLRHRVMRRFKRDKEQGL